MHACKTCTASKRRSEYWDGDWNNRKLGVSCKTCETRPPHERDVGQGHLSEALKQRNAATRIAEFRCGLCNDGAGSTQPRENFWPGDLIARFQRNHTLGCKSCKPIPPNERRQKRPAPGEAPATSTGSQSHRQEPQAEASCVEPPRKRLALSQPK